MRCALGNEWLGVRSIEEYMISRRYIKENMVSRRISLDIFFSLGAKLGEAATLLIVILIIQGARLGNRAQILLPAH